MTEAGKILFSYNLLGNVHTLLQDYGSSTNTPNSMNQTGNRFKKIQYDYDLVSGKVNEVNYQVGKGDAFFHKYSYDTENKLTEVFTSRDKINWEKDAAYTYYKHGPLARTELGELKVQGIDYAYTLQGWLKGVNSTVVSNGDYDIGKDGKQGSANSMVARDVVGFSLNYFNGDYGQINTETNAFVQNTTNVATTAKPLYNGNIASMLVNIPMIGAAQLYGYSYDQLNRIKTMEAFTGVNNTNNTFAAVAQQAYKENISYDPNGNILSYVRNGDAARQQMDDMSYSYKPNTNQLDKVVDVATDAITNYANYNDIKQGQQNANYQYDAIGNLTSDASEGIAINGIVWNVYGKIESITKTNGTVIYYTYDASGNRISKKVALSLAAGGAVKETYYVRDASGNVMAVYTKDASINVGALSQTEVHMYGSSRIGLLNCSINVVSLSSQYTSWLRGDKVFELSNHLGNVLVTVSDKKLAVSANGTTIDYYTADVVTANDYYPSGMQMPGRKYQASSTSTYRYSINGQEKESELNENITTALYWEYDSRIVRRWNVDPIPKVEESPYLCFNGNPIFMKDPNGDDPITGNKKGDRSLKKYERKFNRLKAKMLSQNANTTDASVHTAMNKYNNKKWMWVLAKSGSHDSEQGDGNNNHALYWHIGDVYRLNQGANPTTMQTQTLALVPSQWSQLIQGATPLSMSNTYNIPGNVRGPATVNFTATNNSGGVNIDYSLVQGNGNISTQGALDATTQLPSNVNTAPGASIAMPPVTVDPRQGRAISVIMQVRGYTGNNVNGSISSTVLGTVTFQTVVQLTYYNCRGQMGGNRMPNSQSPDGNRNPFALNAKTMEFLKSRRRLGVHE